MQTILNGLLKKENINYDWDNGHREHLREALTERCKQTFTGREVTQENKDRCKEMASNEHQKTQRLRFVLWRS